MSEIADPPRRLERAHLEDLVAALWAAGYRVVGPVRGDDAIVLDELRSASALPVGWTEEQDAGTYRLARRADEAVFGFATGPHSFKRYLFPPEARLWRAKRSAEGFSVEPEPAPEQPLALFGVRGCDLAAIQIQDRVFLGGPERDPVYASRREGAFVIAVHCGVAGGTCFCVSMDTGPRAGPGFDLALTEVLEPEHHFVVEVGSERGAELLAGLPCAPASEPERAAAEAVVAATAASMGRSLETAGLPRLLLDNLEHPQWEEVATRCLSCANCTMVCPTCFCSSVEDTSDLSGEHAERWRRWDSCFTLGHSYLHGGSVRTSTGARYRQWITHKLATWWEQFDTSGCVGCGRCITWCPPGIDITAEASALRASVAASQEESP
ncbi:MAG TPA: sulfite reductase subunit A [Planctomycetes bacterium]|nr:sulfite reductase subunit A [Planctomycetota bacterium]